ncbi:hypothetical protein SAMN04487830_1347 [Pseudobutyrivibrio sp. OR37]|uniref:transglutaminase domain-containing protein n=1 Tax=Pseudobutyrivibrio sp. OR37 TaxID=1798186 RepID=UPI0008EDF5F5|nr:transglutaminase domain-containing protein [Pseudobutyrivibrio sp. OR37]SFI25078.1 hypothetical protein SAMN04487830_1347 [Pseudobutyrivibrio sp. OR37]
MTMSFRKIATTIISTALVACMAVPAFSMTANAKENNDDLICIPIMKTNGEVYYEYISYEDIQKEWAEQDARGNNYSAVLDYYQNEALKKFTELNADPDQSGYAWCKMPVHIYLGQFNSGLGPNLKRGGSFDSARYAAENPDVAAVVGTNHDALWNHFSKTGIYEGRMGYSTYDTYFNQSIDALNSIIRAGMTDREKVCAVNQWVIENYYYDYERIGKTKPWNKTDTGTIAGVCEDYTARCGYMLDLCGVPNITDSSHAINHIWNRVYVDGKWLVVDCTWNDMQAITTGGDVQITLDASNCYLLVDKHTEQYKDDFECGYAANYGPFFSYGW